MVSCVPAISISAVKSALSGDRESRSLIFETRSRKYMEEGNKIELKKVASYFGLLSLAIASNLKPGHIQATVLCDSELRPRRVELRLPHHAGPKTKKVEGGVYDPKTERVTIETFGGSAEVQLHF